MSDSDADDIEAIRERKREQLQNAASVPEEPIHVEGNDHLQSLVADHDVVLVDFYADWCGPCKMLEPTVETLAAETAAAVAKVDVNAHQAIAREFNVQGVPTLVLFADGTAVEQMVGVKDEQTLRQLVDGYT